MKKMILILFLITGIIFTTEAQRFIASFGVQHTWEVPSHVTSLINRSYHDYEWVHTSRAHREGSLFFDLILQRGDVFIEVSIRNDGYISRRLSREYYPLHEHVCNNHCGYHNNYYKTHYQDCHSHHHHGHNHVAYKHRPNGYAYGFYKAKHLKKHNKGYPHSDHEVYVYSKDKYNKQRRYESDRNEDYRSDSRERRDRYHDTEEYKRGRGNDKFEKKERGGKRQHNSRGASFVHRTK